MQYEERWSLITKLAVPGLSVSLWNCTFDDEGGMPPDQRHQLCFVLSNPGQDSRIRYKAGSWQSEYLKIGRLVFVPANTAINGVGQSVRQRIIQIHFDRESFADVTRLNDLWPGRNLDSCANVYGTPIPQSLVRLAQEVVAPGFAADLLIDAVGTSIMVDLARYFGGRPNEGRESRSGLSPWQVRRARDYIDAHWHPALRISELSQVCGVGERHFRRAFQQATGQGIRSYVEQTRIAKAKVLLVQTDLPLKDLSYQLGFAHASAFSAAFRRATGEAPSQFRRQLHSDAE